MYTFQLSVLNLICLSSDQLHNIFIIYRPISNGAVQVVTYIALTYYLLFLLVIVLLIKPEIWLTFLKHVLIGRDFEITTYYT